MIKQILLAPMKAIASVFARRQTALAPEETLKAIRKQVNFGNPRGLTGHEFPCLGCVRQARSIEQTPCPVHSVDPDA